ncbi:MAG: repeat containing protein, partial [Acidobacteriaceae bacterium]|nr:repeat containing protein [Acidobacteriaceae bacterium]
GNLFIADSGNACVREISGVTASTAVGKCTNDGSGTANTALQKPVSVVSDAVGHLFITDNSAGKVFELLGGSLAPIGGNGLTGTYTTNQEGDAAISVSLLNPQGLGADKSGNLYLADSNNNLVRILSQGLRFTAIGVGNHSNPPQTLWFVITAAVNLTSGPAGNDFRVFQGQNGCTGAIAAPTPGQVQTCKISVQFTPTVPGLRTAPLTLTDSAVSPSAVYRFGLSGLGQGGEAIFNPGTIKTLAAALASPSAIAIDNAGNVYYAEAGTGSGNGSISVLAAGSTTPTTLIAPGAGAASPQALALDPAGNLFIADAATNSVLRYDTSGILTPVVGGLTNPVALVVDPLDNIYVAENGTTPGILKIYAGGQQTLIAGQGSQASPNNVPATSAKFVQLSALYMDPSGNIYVADSGAFFVYQIDTSDIIHTFAGNGTTTDSASGSPLGTGLPGISGVGADPAGDIYIADGVSNRLFVVLSGLPQSVSVSALAGTGTAGYTGDNGPANAATLNSPDAVAVDSAGEVFLADSGNNALREITYPEPALDFGTVKVGATGGPLNTTVWNVGNAGLTPLPGLLVDTTNFGFDTAGSNCPTNLAAGDTCVASFVCNPKSPGSFTTQYNQTAGPQGTTQANLLCIAPPPPVATIAAPAVTVVYGNAYTLSAVISGNQTSAPTGMATISINGTALCLAANVSSGGAVSCTPSPTLKDVGSYTVTVSYSGDTNYPASTSTFTLTVTPRPVTITVDNQTRPVNTPNPTLTGTVANVVAGQSITAAFGTTATTASPAGAYPITAAYVFGAGTNPADYAVTVLNGTLTITTSGTGGGGGGTGGGGGGSTSGSFTLTAAPPEQEIDHQGTVNYPVSLVSTGGFTGTVALNCSGLPEGASCSFSTPNVTLASGATVASIMTIAATADGTNVPTLYSNARPGPRSGPMESHGGPSPLLAWTMLPLGLGGSAGTLFFGRAARRRRQLFLLMPFALLLALGVSGCASPSNYKIYTVTVTGSGVSAGATVKQSATVDLVLGR